MGEKKIHSKLSAGIPITIGEILVNHLDSVATHILAASNGSYKLKLLRSARACYAKKLGAFIHFCVVCKDLSVTALKCRSKACSQCQHKERQDWIENQSEKILKVQYFHVVFTVPHELNPLFYEKQKQSLKCLFNAVSKTLKDVGKELGGQLGAIAVLHTWDQQLNPHYHIHCAVPALFLSEKKAIKIGSSLIDNKVLSAIFAENLQHEIENFLDLMDPLDSAAYERALSQASQKTPVVFLERIKCAPEKIIQYLGRYLKRPGVSSKRLAQTPDGKIALQYKIRKPKDGEKKYGTVEMEPGEFVKKFSHHILPKGFHQTRAFGFLAPSVSKNLPEIQIQLLKTDAPKALPPKTTEVIDNEEPLSSLCRCCRSGTREVLPLINPLQNPVHEIEEAIEKIIHHPDIIPMLDSLFANQDDDHLAKISILDAILGHLHSTADPPKYPPAQPTKPDLSTRRSPPVCTL